MRHEADIYALPCAAFVLSRRSPTFDAAVARRLVATIDEDQQLCRIIKTVKSKLIAKRKTETDMTHSIDWQTMSLQLMTTFAH